jgi:hypothetical protein
MSFDKFINNKIKFTTLISFDVCIENDFVDKLNWKLTTSILVLSIFIVSNVKQFIAKLISCTVPIQFSDNQVDYANEVCFVSDKFFITDNQRFNLNENKMNDWNNNVNNTYTNTFKLQLVNEKIKENEINNNNIKMISYYIWVPYILSCLALSILMTKCLWLNFLKSSMLCTDILEVLRASNLAIQIELKGESSFKI